MLLLAENFTLKVLTRLAHKVLMYGFLLLSYSKFVRKTHRFKEIRLQNAVTFKTGLGVREGH